MSEEPKCGEVWRNENGATRTVRDVDADSCSVTYSRPPPAHPDWLSVSMKDWLMWVDLTHAVRVRKARGVQNDWGYQTDA